MPEFGEEVCAYGVKSFVCLLGIIGIILSFFAARSCEFITFVDTDGNPPDRAEDPPFDNALAANVGIFRYEIINYFNAGGKSNCVDYQETFGAQDGYPSLATAQFCALIAPIMAGIATFAALVDLCVCNFNGSFMTAGLLFVLSCGIQAGTFTLLADPAFCLEDEELQCTTGQGTYLSIAAVVLYGVCSFLMCCAPRADPFCYNFGFGPRKEKRVSPPPSPQQQQQPQTQVIVQPVVIQTPPPAEYDGNKPEQSPTKKNRKMKKTNSGGAKKKSNISNNV